MCYNICCKGCCGVRITKEPEVRKQEILDAAMRLFGLFVDSTAAAAIVSTYFMTVSVGYILNTVTNCFLGVLNGMGKPARSMLLMIFYYIIVRMPSAYLLSGVGLNGIWAAVFVSHICAAASSVLAARDFPARITKSREL